MFIPVLGTNYEVLVNPNLQDCEGVCDTELKTITVTDLRDIRVLRHEFIHAFLYEAGLCDECDWSNNELIVDWFAHMIPKIVYAVDSTLLKGEINDVRETTQGA